MYAVRFFYISYTTTTMKKHLSYQANGRWFLFSHTDGVTIQCKNNPCYLSLKNYFRSQIETLTSFAYYYIEYRYFQPWSAVFIFVSASIGMSLPRNGHSRNFPQEQVRGMHTPQGSSINMYIYDSHICTMTHISWKSEGAL